MKCLGCAVRCLHSLFKYSSVNQHQGSNFIICLIIQVASYRRKSFKDIYLIYTPGLIIHTFEHAVFFCNDKLIHDTVRLRYFKEINRKTTFKVTSLIICITTYTTLCYKLHLVEVKNMRPKKHYTQTF